MTPDHKDLEGNRRRNKRYYQKHRDELLEKARKQYHDNLEYERVRSRTKYYKRREQSNRRLYQDIWEQHFRVKIPDGYHVHHKDQDNKNNEPNNLLALPMSEHFHLHWLLGSYDDRMNRGKNVP